MLTTTPKSTVSIHSNASSVNDERTREILSATDGDQVTAVWLDNNIDIKNDRDSAEKFKKLQSIFHNTKVFTDSRRCIQFITQHSKTGGICMIVSGIIGRSLIPDIHHMDQLHTVFIFGRNTTYHGQWSKNWSKIKGVFGDITDICEALNHSNEKLEESSISLSFMSFDRNGDSKSLNQLDPSFMYTQILKEILLTIEFNEEHREAFIEYYKKGARNEDQTFINDFAQNYNEKPPVFWYSCQSRLYGELNGALRSLDIDRIIKLSFFINDLHGNIEKLHLEQFHGKQKIKNLTVYRGQSIPETYFKKMRATIGGLIAFNNFLSTSKEESIAVRFLRSKLETNEVNILFVMVIDTEKSTVPFAFISKYSAFQENNSEEEYLFSMNTIFRINKIEPYADLDSAYRVDLTLTRDNDRDMHVLTEYIRRETFPDSVGWYRLGAVLLKMGKSEKAEEVYAALLHRARNETDKAAVYNQLGLAKYNQGDYDGATEFYKASLKMYQKVNATDSQEAANSYNNIGNVYFDTKMYSNALSYYEKALNIRKKILSTNHFDIAASYNNLGSAYSAMGNYDEGFTYFKKALKIREAILPSNHPDLASSYTNIGLIHFHNGDYDDALRFYKKDFQICSRTLPPDHIDLMKCHENIGNAYYNIGNLQKAHESYSRAYNIGTKVLTADNPALKLIKELKARCEQ